MREPLRNWIVTLEEDPVTGDLILPLSDEMLEGTGIKLGDIVVWDDNKDGTWSLKKKDDVCDYADTAIEHYMKRCLTLEEEVERLKERIKRLEWSLEEKD